MVHLLRALIALAGDLSLVPRTHIVAPNNLQLQFQGIQQPLLTSASTKHTHTQ